MPNLVYILGAHPWDGPSMHRYRQHSAMAWNSLGFEVRTITPPSILYRLAVRYDRPTVSKWAMYVDKWIVGLPLLAIRLRWRRASLFHIPDHSDALAVFACPKNLPAAATVHDLFAVHAALGHTPERSVARIGRSYQAIVARGLLRTRALAVVSHSTRRDVETTLSRSAVVIHNFVQPPPTASVDHHNSDEPYFLVVAGSGWRKNRSTAIKIFAALRQTDEHSGHRLIVVGGKLDNSERSLVEHLGLLGAIDSRQRVGEPELWDLYRHASALISASRYEGFGWPIVEANSVGTPAILVPTATFAEVGGQAAIFVDDAEPDLFEIAEVSRRLTVDAEALRSAALDNATRFTLDAVRGAWLRLFETANAYPASPHSDRTGD